MNKFPMRFQTICSCKFIILFKPFAFWGLCDIFSARILKSKIKNIETKNISYSQFLSAQSPKIKYTHSFEFISSKQRLLQNKPKKKYDRNPIPSRGWDQKKS